MLKGLIGIAGDVVKTVTAPVEIATDITRAVTKPVADLAGDLVDEVKRATSSGKQNNDR